MSRYSYINAEINICKPQIIMEIGTFMGHRAESMISTAMKHKKDVAYYGFDLFDDFKEFEKEFCYKGVANVEKVKRKLSKFKNINLIKGNTKETLKNFNINPDFVFLDGGHSLETIENDWNNVYRLMKKNTVVIFDDYYYNRDDVGAKKIISEILKDSNFKVKMYDNPDTFNDKRLGKLIIGLVKVEFANNEN